MPRSDDVARLLADLGRTGQVTYRQGKVLRWDVAARTNTILVAGAEIPDVPVLNTAGMASIAPGTNVGILQVGAQYFILGAISLPGAGPFLVAGLMGPADPQFDSWPSTTSSTDTDLWAGFVIRGSTELSFWFRTYVQAGCTAVFTFLINGQEIVNSGTYEEGIGQFNDRVAWPGDVPFGLDATVTLRARVTSGTGKAAASMQGTYMI